MPSAAVWDWVWTIGGPFAAVCLALWAFYTGRVYSKSAYDNMVAEKDKTIREKDKVIAEYWEDIVKPSIRVAERALDTKETASREVGRKPR